MFPAIVSVVRVARWAVEYRAAFHSDVVLDLIGYRRHGHSEVDDPTITQPLLYRAIEEHPPLWQIYAADIQADDTEARVGNIRSEFEAAQKKASTLTKKPSLRQLPHYWDHYKGGRHKSEYEVQTGVPLDELRPVTEPLTT